MLYERISPPELASLSSRLPDSVEYRYWDCWERCPCIAKQASPNIRNLNNHWGTWYEVETLDWWHRVAVGRSAYEEVLGQVKDNAWFSGPREQACEKLPTCSLWIVLYPPTWMSKAWSLGWQTVAGGLEGMKTNPLRV